MEQQQQQNNGSTNGGDQSTDKLLFVKATSVGEDSKGRQKIDLRLSIEETEALRQELANKSRAKIQLHIGEGTYGPTAFFFVKEVQEKVAGAGGGYQKPAATKASVNTASKIEALKKK